MLVAVDDVQWLDSASARALRYAIRRLDAEPVGVWRPCVSAGSADPLRPQGSCRPAGREALDLLPLGLSELRGVLRRTVSRDLAPGAAADLRDLRGKPTLRTRARANPGRSRRRVGLRAGPAAARTRCGRRSSSRLESVPGELLPLLETTSALGRTTVAELRGALPGSDVEALLAAAVEPGILVVADDLEVRFSHPLVGSVVYARMSPLGVATSTRGWSASRPTSTFGRGISRCRRRARTGTWPRCSKRRRNAPPAVARPTPPPSSRGTALRLTPSGEADARRRRALQEIVRRGAAGEMRRALALADALVDGLPPGPGRAEALVQRAQLEDEDVEAGEVLLVRALEDAGGDELLRGRVLDQLGWLRGVFRGDLRAGIECAREALAVAESLGDKEFEMSAAAGLSNMETLAGHPAPGPDDAGGEDRGGGRPAGSVGRPSRPARRAAPLGGRPSRRAGAARGRRGRGRAVEQRALAPLRPLRPRRSRVGRREPCRGGRAPRPGHGGGAGQRGRPRRELDLLPPRARGDLARPRRGRAQGGGPAARGGRAARRAPRRSPGRAASSGCWPSRRATRPPPPGSSWRRRGCSRRWGSPIPARSPRCRTGSRPSPSPATSSTPACCSSASRGRPTRSGARGRWRRWSEAAGVVALAGGRAEAAVSLLGAAGSSFEQLGFLPDAARADLLLGRALLRAGRRTAAAEALSASRARFAAMGGGALGGARRRGAGARLAGSSRRRADSDGEARRRPRRSRG